jgi:hypothetical protein
MGFEGMDWIGEKKDERKKRRQEKGDFNLWSGPHFPLSSLVF